MVSQVVIRLKHTRRGHVVLYDWYSFNFINNDRRSNTSLLTRFTKAFYALADEPQLTFFLYADPQEILRRKHELSVSTITQLTQDYQALFGQLGPRCRHSRYVPIKNHDFNDTLKLIGEYIRQLI